jgi:hypothetical protein
MSWRDHIKVHPAAELFPMMDADSLRALGEDIKANGQRIMVAFYRDTEGAHWLLDGRNRLDARELAGWQIGAVANRGSGWAIEARDPKGYPDNLTVKIITDIAGTPGFDPYAYVISANIHRRHLTAADKDRLIADVLAARPEMSNREVAKAVKVDHHKVAKVRAEGERVGKIPHVEKRTDSKGRQQPAHKVAHKEGTPYAEPPRVQLDELPDLAASTTVAPEPTAPLPDFPATREALAAERRRNKSLLSDLRVRDDRIKELEALPNIKKLVSGLATGDLYRFGRWFKDTIDPEPAYRARSELPSAIVDGMPPVAAEPVQATEAAPATTPAPEPGTGHCSAAPPRLVTLSPMC